MADDHDDHTPGSMDIRGHQKTYAGFIRIAIWGIVISLGALVFLTLSNV